MKITAGWMKMLSSASSCVLLSPSPCLCIPCQRYCRTLLLLHLYSSQCTPLLQSKAVWQIMIISLPRISSPSDGQVRSDSVRFSRHFKSKVCISGLKGSVFVLLYKAKQRQSGQSVGAVKPLCAVKESGLMI